MVSCKRLPLPTWLTGISYICNVSYQKPWPSRPSNESCCPFLPNTLWTTHFVFYFCFVPCIYFDVSNKAGVHRTPLYTTVQCPHHCTVYNILLPTTFHCSLYPGAALFYFSPRHLTVRDIRFHCPQNSHVLAILLISFAIIGQERLGNHPVHIRRHFVLVDVLFLVCRFISRL